jgi:protoheme IX farnesyltransferase
MLTKPTLSILVVFSSVVSFMLTRGYEAFNDPLYRILSLFVSGFLVTGSANAINQCVEKDTDAGMKRTASRPIASGRMSVQAGWIFAIVTGILGVGGLAWVFNTLTAALAAFSLFLYAFIYTPLKKVSSMAVLMGALPGALPCLIGWTAGEGELSVGGWIVFMFQFFWQFPHFWAIAWVAHRDYSAVGFKLLPADQGPTKFTALQTVLYSLLLVPVTLMPYFTGICEYASVSGQVGLVLVILSNGFMILRCVQLYNGMDVKQARRVMFGSYLYLPVVMLSWLLSKTPIG